MTAEAIHGLLPYAVNFSIVVVAVFALARKPLHKHLYQRHERMQDAFQSAEISHRKASDRIAAAKASMANLNREESALLVAEAEAARHEGAELLQKARTEAERVQAEAERMASVEQEESSERVKAEFLSLVVREAEESLRRSLKKDDHSAILKRAQNSIEVGV